MDEIGKDDWLRYAGGISLDGNYATSDRNANLFTYLLKANLNITFAGQIQIPLMLSITDGGVNIPTPFNYNRLSLSPSWKNIRLNWGDFNPSFSSYSMQGIPVTGMGLQLENTGAFSAEVFTGRLQKRILFGTAHPETLPVYKRSGYGARFRHDFDKLTLEGIFFAARDHRGSLTDSLSIDKADFPSSNQVWHISGVYRLNPNFKVMVGLAGSHWKTTLFNAQGNNAVSRKYFYKAMNFSLDVSTDNGGLELKYERLDPGFRSMGTHFFNNDLEQITLKLQQSLFSGKIGISMHSGIQRNDLQQKKSSNTLKMVNAMSITYDSGKQLRMQVDYSNFTTRINTKDPFEERISEPIVHDTVTYRQINENASLSAYINFTSSADLHVNISAQRSVTGDPDALAPLNFQATTGYGQNIKKFGISINTSLNYALLVSKESHDFTLGPNLGISQKFLKDRLRSGVTVSWNKHRKNGAWQGTNVTIRCRNVWTIRKNQSLTMNVGSVFRESGLNRSSAINISAGYRYTFNSLDKYKVEIGRKKMTDRNSELQFKFRGIVYKGSIPEVTAQIQNLTAQLGVGELLPAERKQLKDSFKDLKEYERKGAFRFHAIAYLRSAYAITKTFHDYQEMLDNLFRHFIRDVQTAEPGQADTGSLIDDHEEVRSAINRKVHSRLLKKLALVSDFNSAMLVIPELREFQELHFKNYSKLREGERFLESRKVALEIELIDFLFKSLLTIAEDHLLRSMSNNKEP
ncbi:hypothetical protein DMZ48_09845 [Robertkochia solimangrovi]|nr:hypothetical protein DMZ48_09845 [Robertkochia solimangrovi]